MYDTDFNLIADDQYYRVEIHEKPSLMYVFWKRHVEGEVLREKYLTLLSIVKKFEPKSWLGNARAMYYTTVQDARWIFDYFLPNLLESSICRYARLESPKSLLILDSMKLQDKISNLSEAKTGELEFQFFTDEELAIGWLTA
ncbi:hypothetical protein [uncultured Pontibacter sp.]|uniref:hypothetical protein n=1 Tax=uncultured Pontibacter sp. TaxID=453356 RepID=UPI00260249B3|nr:hypothetical protein [uncultured Pontibacter sp.]